MNTFQLTCFLTVAETLNFARTAELLNVTQPAVTHQIHSLETELNVKLFRRTTRMVELTSAGKLFLNDAQNMVDISIRAKKRFENPAEQEQQIFSIGCHGTSHLFLLTEVLQNMLVQYPNLHPRFRVVPFPHLYRFLDEEDVDVVLGFQISDHHKKTIRNYRELCRVPVVCLLPADHPLAAHETLTATDLLEENLILRDPSKSPPDLLRFWIDLAENRRSPRFYFCESTEAQIVLTRSGFGAAIVPALFSPPDASLIKIPIEGITPLSFGLYYKTLQGNEILKTFLAQMAELFSRKNFL